VSKENGFLARLAKSISSAASLTRPSLHLFLRRRAFCHGCCCFVLEKFAVWYEIGGSREFSPVGLPCRLLGHYTWPIVSEISHDHQQSGTRTTNTIPRPAAAPPFWDALLWQK
jgi:hypothetical protein